MIYEYLASKSVLPRRVDSVKHGYIKAHGKERAEDKLKKKHYKNILIVREVS